MTDPIMIDTSVYREGRPWRLRTQRSDDHRAMSAIYAPIHRQFRIPADKQHHYE
ncbi:MULTISPECIES: hypothetical protein [unclassified Frankia]|uniref:hypothetical protein n=1 Tax=unclassified Frankia TaxID=2632575 RepID=UPI002AD3CDF4|nr:MULTISPECIES: hypothetical protein [unclassified Frankia]